MFDLGNFIKILCYSNEKQQSFLFFEEHFQNNFPDKNDLHS